VRPVIAERLVETLNAGETPRVRMPAALGASDLAPMADLARGVLRDVPLAHGEGLVLIDSSAYGAALAELALADAARLLDSADVPGALALEGFAADLSTLDTAFKSSIAAHSRIRERNRVQFSGQTAASLEAGWPRAQIGFSKRGRPRALTTSPRSEAAS